MASGRGRAPGALPAAGMRAWGGLAGPLARAWTLRGLRGAPAAASPAFARPSGPARWRAAAAVEVGEAAGAAASGGPGAVRTRFAPSPTGNLHVGGARTALFNWLYAKQQGGTFIVRVEDTDAARSTKESEAAVLRDLKWMGMQWDEGPDVGGDFGPYRQSERTAIYKEYAAKLVEAGAAYPCFCTDEELAAMKAQAERDGRPPVYSGKWASASAAEVEAEMAKETPYVYRFRVPKDREVTIADLVRGDVTWNTNTLGDFVLIRSNGLPVYNFCVAIDDALMKVTHVLRAEEHLPNTLRQALVYDALGFQQPTFGHMSLILAPDKSKLSKRHGATSVGDFEKEGYLKEAMVNYLSLLGWNDGSEQEIYSVDELVESFSLDRITKSGAVFDKVKLNWMNGEHLKAMPEADRLAAASAAVLAAGLLTEADADLLGLVLELSLDSMEKVDDCVPRLRDLLAYPLEETLAGKGARKFVDNGFREFAAAVVAAHEAGALAEALAGDGGAFKGWVQGLGKELGVKGKNLFMPLRIALTGKMAGPDVGAQMQVLQRADPLVGPGADYVDLTARMAALKRWTEAA